jgi:hypothetical protein
MSNNLRQNGLGLVPKGIVGRLISVCRELEWLHELPLEVQLQAYGYLVTSESSPSRELQGRLRTDKAIDAHILRRHLELIFTKRVETTQGDVWMSDTVLSGREQFEIISGLQNRAIVRRNVQTEHGPSYVISKPQD